jgi:hypothetical protein
MSGLTLADRAEALFASNLSAWPWPTANEVAVAISDALMRYGGTHGCAGEVAGAYGEYPETAAPRMRWARRLVEAMSPSRTGTQAISASAADRLLLLNVEHEADA